MLLEDTPFFTVFRLSALFVVAPLGGIAHRRHGSSGAHFLRSFGLEDLQEARAANLRSII